jgi:hypothetical protein
VQTLLRSVLQIWTYLSNVRCSLVCYSAPVGKQPEQHSVAARDQLVPYKPESRVSAAFDCGKRIQNLLCCTVKCLLLMHCILHWNTVLCFRPTVNTQNGHRRSECSYQLTAGRTPARAPTSLVSHGRPQLHAVSVATWLLAFALVWHKQGPCVFINPVELYWIATISKSFNMVASWLFDHLYLSIYLSVHLSISLSVCLSSSPSIRTRN